MITHTYTYATLPVSKRTFDEIKKKLLKAKYSEYVKDNVLIMQGIGLVENKSKK